jgi:phytoene dehydrogenase-like protein
MQLYRCTEPIGKGCAQYSEQVVSGLHSAATACGAGFRFGAEVASIDSSGGAVEGVTLASGERLAADIVVSNRDLPAAYPLLGGDSQQHGRRQHAKLTAKEYSAGVISYNWNVGRRFDQLQHHNVFLSGRPKRMCRYCVVGLLMAAALIRGAPMKPLQRALPYCS